MDVDRGQLVGRRLKDVAVVLGQTDSGVTARVFGSLLTWLNDHDSDVFFVGTCNDASKLPPEFARAERFDGALCANDR